MLVGLSIRGIVLIDRLDLALEPGLNVMTGETGAGKSILLDALGFALGARADAALIRRGAERASVSAEFALPVDHPVRAMLEEQGLAASESLVLRRVLSRNGASRAFINDEPASVSLMRRIGGALVQIQGQGEQNSLLSTATHRAVLDAFAGLGAEADVLAASHDRMRAAMDALATAESDAARALEEETYLRHMVAELDALEPKPGEEAALDKQRTLLRHAERIAAAVHEAAALLTGESGAEVRLSRAVGALERVKSEAAGHLDSALAALERAAIELGDALAEIEAAGERVAPDPGRLEAVEERVFALRAAARKHQTSADELADLRDRLVEKLAAAEDAAGVRAGLSESAGRARDDYRRRASKLTKARTRSAHEFDAAVMAELCHLKFDKALFRTVVTPCEEADWTRAGADRIAFEVATIPGLEPGPLIRVASGGELSRLLLALKVVLAGRGSAPTLVFDEVDRGVGGATAAAVGERMSGLARSAQVLVVTHSPQVAARAVHHWRIAKHTTGDGGLAAGIVRLVGDQRREEIARMLAGVRVTEAARRAASSLIESSGTPGLGPPSP